MKTAKFILLVLCVTFAVHCSHLKSTRTTNIKSYTLNVDEQSTIGVPMITSGHITYGTAAGNHGLSEEQDSWQSFEYITNDSYKEELVYKGRSDSSIEIAYKQYKKMLSSPSSSQELTFDLSSSDTIAFKNYKIKVLNATSEYIRFRVLSDSGASAAP